MTPDARDTLADADRGASEVVAVALLIGIVVLGVAAITLIGGPELASNQDTVEIQQVERALVQYDAESFRVANGGTTAQRVDLGMKVNQGTLDVENDTGRVTVTYINTSSGASTEVMNRTVGTVVYENGDTTVGYQGGGVWRSDGNGSTMVSPPEISFREKTLTMPVVVTRGGSVYSEVQLTRTASRERFPNATIGLTNRLTNSKIRVVVRSRYYRAWGAFFAEETGAIVQYDHADNEVIVTFLALPKNFAPDAGVIATSGPGQLRLLGTGAYIDSYNSSVGPYSVSNTSEGVVEAAGDIRMEGDSTIDGDAHSGEDINLSGGATITGNATANGTVMVDGSSTVEGNIVNGSRNIVDQPPINTLVNDKVDDLKNRNDNNETSVIQNEELQFSDSATLGPGVYYLENFDLQGQDLVLNATGGDITIAVRDWMRLEKAGGTNSHIEVKGNGTVRVFVKSKSQVEVNVPGEGTDRTHFFVERDGAILVPGQKSPRFQIYGTDNFEGDIGGSSSEHPNVTAAIIAPAGYAGSGNFYIKQGDLYGAIVTGNLTLGQYGRVHFDRALLDEELLLAPNIPRLDYLYIVEYELEVRDS
ncbi:MAG: polymer-forming cytoskeletal protein [Haloferacaceae archaeon]